MPRAIRMPATDRPLTSAEVALARSVFGDVLHVEHIRLHRAKWWMFQPAWIVMAPDGHIWCHPNGDRWCEDFTLRSRSYRALLVHELVHCWQHQQGVNLILHRPPWARYRYTLTPGKRFTAYGLEQQASIVEDAFWLRDGGTLSGKPGLVEYAKVIPFGVWS